MLNVGSTPIASSAKYFTMGDYRLYQVDAGRLSKVTPAKLHKHKNLSGAIEAAKVYAERCNGRRREPIVLQFAIQEYTSTYNATIVKLLKL